MSLVSRRMVELKRMKKKIGLWGRPEARDVSKIPQGSEPYIARNTTSHNNQLTRHRTGQARIERWNVGCKEKRRQVRSRDGRAGIQHETRGKSKSAAHDPSHTTTATRVEAQDNAAHWATKQRHSNRPGQEASRTASKSKDEPCISRGNSQQHSGTRNKSSSQYHTRQPTSQQQQSAAVNSERGIEETDRRSSQQRTQQPTSQQQQQPTKSTAQTHDNKQDSGRHTTTNMTAGETQQPTRRQQR
jgi:hypothetical protein